jgi:hypothetical protein
MAKETKAVVTQAWEKLRRAGKDPWPQLSTKQLLETFRGRVELPPKKIHAHRH